MEIQNLSVYLVEPSTTQRKLIGQYLNELGILNIDSFNSGSEALEAMRQTPPDLVISTLYLPDMDGAELVTSIRQDTAISALPFILISSETRFRYLDPVRQAGTIAILTKPFSRDDLQTALIAALDYLESSELELGDVAVDTDSLQVLIVDDSFTSRNHIRRMLEGMGVERIQEAEDGAEGARMVNEHYYDLVISDYNMPRMNGQELVDYIRIESGQPGLPILMVTSEENESRLAAVQQSGVSAICDKPFQPATLKSLLEKILREM
jgi:two-component system chemotaxis response regulator CheY